MQVVEQTTEYRGSRRATDAWLDSCGDARPFKGLPEGMDRKDLIRLVKSAGARVGLRRNMIDYLAFQVSYTRDQDWRAGERPIGYVTVFAAARRLGVSERQIHRLERALNRAGAIGWNDSANHRRTGKRDKDTGRIIFAYGVDLSPLARLVPELRAQEQAQARDPRHAGARRGGPTDRPGRRGMALQDRQPRLPRPDNHRGAFSGRGGQPPQAAERRAQGPARALPGARAKMWKKL